jgi:hypothetical protein
MTNKRLLSAALAFGLAASGAVLTSGCREKGPGERAGEKVDRALDKVEDTFDPKGPAEKAGRKLDRAIDDAKD